MGYMVHHAIIVTCYDNEFLQEAHLKAITIGLTVTDIEHSVMNSYVSFLVCPDGSKEGWSDSNDGDEWKDEFVTWLKKQVFKDGSTCYDWCHVKYGDEDGDNKMLDSSD